jgi:alkylation response protein AidB-like acyl-CoA dehydrogenase
MSPIEAEELRALRSTARKVFAGDADLATLGELGLLGLLTPESAGGSGWRVVEAVAVAAEAGRALSQLAWTGTALAAAALAGAPGHRNLVAELVAGRAVGAWSERGSATGPGRGPDGEWSVSETAVLPGASLPSALVLAQPGGPALLVAGAARGLSLRRCGDPLDTRRGELELTLSDAPAEVLPVTDVDVLADTAVLLACADTQGALAGVKDLLVSHLSRREAFGQPLAAFQVLQHRLADLDVLAAQAEALIEAAAGALAEGSYRAGQLVNAAHRFVGDRFPAALDDCIQLSGGIGFAWEWPVHHALRRCLVNAAVRVRRTPTASGLRAALTGRPDAPEGFREQVRSVIARHAPAPAREGHRAPTSAPQDAELRAWYRVMFETGLLGASWPEGWGGRPDHDPIHDLVVTEELIRARAPRPIDQVQLAAHMLLEHGTAEQRSRYLPRIRTAEDIWCQLFSEPDAGSDLAGVRTRAKQADDGSWVVTGQKIWTALVRTSVTDRRHDGLTVFVVPMDAAGLEIRPIRTIGGATEFNEVFLDGVVLGPEQVMGEVGRGWAVMMAGLEVERFGVGGNVVLLELLLRDVLDVATGLRREGVPLDEDPTILSAVEGLLAESEAARAFVEGQIDRVLAQREGVAEASIAKIAYTEAYNRIARYGTELVTGFGPVGPAGPEGEPAREAGQRLRDAWLWSRALTISGGSSEVMRNIIAKRRLQLPSGR